MASKIKVGDTVIVIAGKEKDKEGKVIAIDHKKGTVIVEGVNMVSKHTKPNASNPNGGIISKESPLDISNVMYSEGGKAVRVGFEVQDGKKVRVSKKSGKKLD